MPQTIYLKDYTAPAYSITHVELSFQIFEDHTLVDSKLHVETHAQNSEAFFLNGEHLELCQIRLDGQEAHYELSDKGLNIAVPDKESFTLEIQTKIDPAANTALEGLYKSGGTYCTQCEAEGFRRITYFPDRPDIMATYKVRLEADKKACPVLLSNGNLVEEGNLEGGRHYTLWDDPTPKPCYLFALVAGDLVHIKDRFTTRSGLDVDLKIYVRPGDEMQCDHAMESLKKSMRWDEDIYGREYQYKNFNIVAVSDFNMGAMENTSLNIFNTALVLAHPETATDTDFMRVEGVIAHEYFHNWTGNRITCRDWFQLSLKEGLTVFRDQEFSADQNSSAVQRIDDVVQLRRHQFPEDAGPLAHPVRPESYIEINNFYTTTVYEKGAEVIRMFHHILGPETYRKATDLYFDKHDGQAVTCEDWAQCMEDASGIDLTQFKLWYSQAGTPEVAAKGSYDAQNKSYTLSFKQTIPVTPGQDNPQAMHIPIAVGLLDHNGQDIIETQTLHLKEAEQSFTFEDVASKPVPSMLRGFSAPIKLQHDLSSKDLRFLMIQDSDGFNRWDAAQTFILQSMHDMIDRVERNEVFEVDNDLLDALGVYVHEALKPGRKLGRDKALLARCLTLPDLSIIGQQRSIVDPEAIYTVRNAIIQAVGTLYEDELRDIYEKHHDTRAFSKHPQAMAQRALKNIVLRYLDCAELTRRQYETANNMTDRVCALSILGDYDNDANKTPFQDFYARYQSFDLVVDKWFALQAMAVRSDIMDDLHYLQNHPEFTLKNPNRVRSLYAAFAMNNPVCFHRKDGSGYDFLKSAIVELNSTNPQIAARLLTPLKEWKRYTQDRQGKMKEILQEIKNLQDLSPDVYEIVTKSLEG